MTNSKREFIVHQHSHAGWDTKTYKAVSFEAAARMSVRKRHQFLTARNHSIRFEDGRYIVTYEGSLREEPLNPYCRYQSKGDYWFGDKIREGLPDDCGLCGGTGINHYNPFMQCWACGDQKQQGKGTGKVGSQS